MRRVLVAAALAATPALALAQGATPFGLTLGGSLEVELDLDRNGKRRGQSGYSDLYTKTELQLYLNLPAGFTVNLVGKLEPADRDPDGQDRLFNTHAGWIDQLYLSWARGPVELYGGKIHPAFGLAWDIAPGLYGTDFAEEYELTEKIGFGAALSLSDLLGLTGTYGQHQIRAEVFHADTSGLSSSVLSARWLDPQETSARGRNIYRRTNRQRFGGADNTDSFDNYALSLAGSGVPLPIGTLQYTLGHTLRRAGDDSRAAGTAADERGYVAGLAWEIPLPLRVTATPLVEVVRLDNAGGVQDQRSEYLTAGLALDRKPWSVAYVFATNRMQDTNLGGDTVRTQTMASVSLDVGSYVPLGLLDGLQATLGWRRLREDGISANDYGAQLVWSQKF